MLRKQIFYIFVGFTYFQRTLFHIGFFIMGVVKCKEVCKPVYKRWHTTTIHYVHRCSTWPRLKWLSRNFSYKSANDCAKESMKTCRISCTLDLKKPCALGFEIFGVVWRHQEVPVRLLKTVKKFQIPIHLFVWKTSKTRILWYLHWLPSMIGGRVIAENGLKWHESGFRGPWRVSTLFHLLTISASTLCNPIRKYSDSFSNLNFTEKENILLVSSL